MRAHEAALRAWLVVLGLGVCTPGVAAADDGAVAGWPKEVAVVRYRSSADGSEQPTLWYHPGGSRPVPLLVALHTWSGDYRQAESQYATWCIARGWALLHPDFRGRNNRPEACGSELAVRDILDAVAFARRSAPIDSRRIYLVGVSGGGHASLLLAGRAPELWAGVSAWCPLYDLRSWHAETRARRLAYAAALEACCGGPPGKSAEADEQYRLRSPSTYLARAAGVPLDINTGIADGHTGSVPVSHALRAYNALAAPADRIAEADIAAMAARPAMPARLLRRVDDPGYQVRPVLYRNTSGSVRVTVFQGGHEMIHDAALEWLGRQSREKPAAADPR